MKNTELISIYKEVTGCVTFMPESEWNRAGFEVVKDTICGMFLTLWKKPKNNKKYKRMYVYCEKQVHQIAII